MRVLQFAGGLLLVLAVYVLFKGITYSSQRNVVEVGDFKASVEEKRSVPLWAAAAAGGAGILLLIVGSRRRG